MIHLTKHSQAEVRVKTGKKFLTFILDKEEYAIDILNVQEIKGSKSRINLTPVIEAPAHIIGILYLYDQIIPVIDLRIFYHLNPIDQNDSHVIIIIKHHDKLFGLSVDGVLDIVELQSENIKKPPDFLAIIERDYIDGVGACNEHLLMILNINKLFTNSELRLEYFIENNPVKP